ncbi:hypothetical protein NDU88_012335 [Pleurodeles waltl]|uniref:Uncharacterized protein n=1 Tax=Pleurodeles waltl TaxID=8319 RepID=A0AAV7R5J0_PLEWA|nr:hypothetical protein NDU88_012335 [Pleurodeles waltl]
MRLGQCIEAWVGLGLEPGGMRTSFLHGYRNGYAGPYTRAQEHHQIHFLIKHAVGISHQHQNKRRVLNEDRVPSMNFPQHQHLMNLVKSSASLPKDGT